MGWRTVLTTEERAKYLAKLEKFEQAYDSLLMGGQAVSFTDQNQESIRYTAANAPRLLAAINALRAQLGMCPYLLPMADRPAGVLF